MAQSQLQHFTYFLLTALLTLTPASTKAHMDHSTGLKLMADTLEWPIPMSMYSADQEEDDEDGEFDDGFVDLEEAENQEENGRRSLFWRRFRYYISYGALAAGRVPCPPRSGRSYYTHNCYNTKVPVNPYTRGCSRITRCRVCHGIMGLVGLTVVAFA